MATASTWFNILFWSVVCGFVTHFVVTQLGRGLPMVKRILSHTVPKLWPSNPAYFILIFLLPGVLSQFVGGPLPLLLLLIWIGYNVRRAMNPPAESAEEAKLANLTFKLHTVNSKRLKSVTIGNAYRGTFISGGAGCGKSVSIIEPIIQQAGAAGVTGVVYDFKFPTLAKVVAGSYAGTRVTPYFVNFNDLTRSHRINPLAPKILTTASFAREAARTILVNLDFKAAQDRSFWLQSAETLLSGCIWYLRCNHPDQCSLPGAVSMILENDATTLVARLQDDNEVRGMIASISSANKSENTIAGVFSTIQNYLAVLNTPEIFWVMSGHDVPTDLNSSETPGILVVGNDPSLISTYSPLISLIVSSCIKRMNQQGRLPSLVLLDEAPTLFIPNFAQIPATARSNKIATVYAVQDVAQMEGLMNREETEMILSNLGNQFWGRSTSTATTERVSKMFGKMDLKYETDTYNKGKGGRSSSRSYSFQERDIMQAAEVMLFDVGKFAGLVVESDIARFTATFKPSTNNGVAIAPFQEVTAADTRQNFKAIKAQIRDIVKGQQPPLSGPTSTAPPYFPIPD